LTYDNVHSTSRAMSYQSSRFRPATSHLPGRVVWLHRAPQLRASAAALQSRSTPSRAQIPIGPTIESISSAPDSHQRLSRRRSVDNLDCSNHDFGEADVESAVRLLAAA